MAVGILFEIPGATQRQYDNVIQKLEDAGAATPKGRRYHAAGPTEGGWRVADVWESESDFEEFGKTLMPFLQEEGFPQFEPRVWQLHNVIEG